MQAADRGAGVSVELNAATATRVRYTDHLRVATVEREGSLKTGDVFVFTLPDDFISAGDMQAMVDYVDAEGLQVKQMFVCHALRRALIQCSALMFDSFTISTELKADKDVPPRIIRMVT